MATFKTKKRLIPKKHTSALLRRGAKDVVEIPASSVVVADWVLMKCKFGCSGYGRCLTCPPHSPTPDQMRKILEGYSRALLVHFTFDGEWRDLRKIIASAERSLFLDGFEKVWALASGPCELCDECPMDECVYPNTARPSMEACGIDVFSTARAAGLPIEVVTSYEQRVNTYCLLLVD